MFEDYLIDAAQFRNDAVSSTENSAIKRNYRAAVFNLTSSIESYVFYQAIVLGMGQIADAEKAFLLDRQYALSGAGFTITNTPRYNPVDQKIKFLLAKFSPDVKIGSIREWPKFLEFKKFRDKLTHPREEIDPYSIEDYKKQVQAGFLSVVTLMNLLSIGIYRKHLRQSLLDLKE